MESVAKSTPIVLSMGDTPWRRRVGAIMDEIDESDEQDELGYYYPESNGLDFDDLSLRRSLASVRLLLMLWRIPGEYDDYAVLAEARLWRWLVARLDTNLTAFARNAVSELRKSDRQQSIQSILDLIPAAPRTVSEADGSLHPDEPLGRALNLMDSLCAQFGLYMDRDIFGGMGELADMIFELEMQRGRLSPRLRMVTQDTTIPDLVAQREPAGTTLSTGDAAPVPQGSTGPNLKVREGGVGSPDHVSSKIVPLRTGRPPANFDREQARQVAVDFCRTYNRVPSASEIYRRLGSDQKGKGRSEATFRKHLGPWSREADWPRPSSAKREAAIPDSSNRSRETLG